MKKFLSILLTIALLLTFAAFALGSSSTEDTKVEAKESAETVAAPQQEADKNERTEIRVGETLNVNEFKITFDSAEKWSSDNQFIEPKEGKQFIRLHFSVANDTKSDRYVSSAEFDCYADGEKCDLSYYGDEMLSCDSISSGRKTSGYVYFEVPVNAQQIEVEYETSLWTNHKAYFIVDQL